MALTSYLNILQAPVSGLWLGAVGVTEPTGNAQAVGAGWTDAGATDGGVTAEIQQSYSRVTVDQVAGGVDARLTDLIMKITTNLAEVTLANYRVALNQATSANTYVEADPTITGNSPNFSAVLLRGVRPGQGGPRTIIMRRGLSTANITGAYKKDGQTFIPVTFEGYYVSTSIKPFKIDDTP